MVTDPTAPEFAAYWRGTLARNDSDAHAAEADRALVLELEGLRTRSAELAAALTQAQAAIAVRHDLLSAQTAAIEERDEELTGLRSENDALRSENETVRATYDDVVHSRRWRTFDLLARPARAAKDSVARVRGRA